MQTVEQYQLTDSEYKKAKALATENKIKNELLKNPILSKYDQTAMRQAIQRNNVEITKIIRAAKRRSLGMKVVGVDE